MTAHHLLQVTFWVRPGSFSSGENPENFALNSFLASHTSWAFFFFFAFFFFAGGGVAARLGDLSSLTGDPTVPPPVEVLTTGPPGKSPFLGL